MSDKKSCNPPLDSETVIKKEIKPLQGSGKHLLENPDIFAPEEVSDPDYDPDLEIKHKLLDYEMSSFILESARDVKEEVLNIEKKKGFWRKCILVGTLILFIVNVLALITLAVLDAVGCIDISNVAMLSLLGASFAHIVSLLILFIKFVTSTRHLDMYKTITEMLIQHKNTK